MKLKDMAALVFAVGVGGTALFFSCGKSDSSDDETTATSEGKDVTQAFTMAIKTASVDFPASALDAGTKVEMKSTTTAPTEFAADGVSNASAPMILSAIDAKGAAVAQAKAPMTIALSLETTPAGLADVEKLAANICILSKGADAVVRKWINKNLTIDAATGKITFKGIWFGTFQALYCGENFADIAVVNAEGTDVEKKETDTSTETNTATTTPTGTNTATITNTNTNTNTNTADVTCNTVVNNATAIVVPATPDASPMPEPQGGILIDGHYELVGIQTYEGVDQLPQGTVKDSFDLYGLTMQYVSESSGQPVSRETFTIAPSSPALNSTRICAYGTSDAPIPITGYEVSEDSIRLFVQLLNYIAIYQKIP